MARKGINGSNKGKEYERKIAKILGSYWGEDFNRTPMSGGLHWKADNRVSGDIVTPPDSVFPFVVECKKREKWDFAQVLKGTGEVESWWKQVTRDSKETDLRQLLIFSKNFAPDYMMITAQDFITLVRDKKETGFNYFFVHIEGQSDRVICRLDDFIKFVSKEVVIQAYNL